MRGIIQLALTLSLAFGENRDLLSIVKETHRARAMDIKNKLLVHVSKLDLLNFCALFLLFLCACADLVSTHNNLARRIKRLIPALIIHQRVSRRSNKLVMSVCKRERKKSQRQNRTLTSTRRKASSRSKLAQLVRLMRLFVVS